MTDLNNLLKLETRFLRHPVNQRILGDYIICLRDGISMDSWAEDVAEASESYPYTELELEYFLFILQTIS